MIENCLTQNCVCTTIPIQAWFVIGIGVFMGIVTGFGIVVWYLTKPQ